MRLFSKGLPFVAVCMGLLATSCSNEAPWGDESGEIGRIALKLSTDASVLRSTRAEDNVCPVIPGADEFSVSLKSDDGTYSKTWGSLASFNKEEGFPMGSYTLSASYGKENSMGFDKPYFTGSTHVNVILGQETPVILKTELANAMLSVRFADNMGKWFSNVTVAASSDKSEEKVNFTSATSRPTFVPVGEVKLQATVTNEKGEKVSLGLVNVTTAPKHHYIVNVAVTNDVVTGESVLSVSFDEDVIAENVEIVLSDELFNAPAPYIETKNIPEDGSIEHFDQIVYNGKSPEFHIFCYGGIKSAKLKVTGGSNILSNKKIELVTTDADIQSQLNEAGVECSGLFRNVGSLGVVNFKEFLSRAGVGTYNVSLSVTDALGREVEASAEPKLKVDILPVTFGIEPAENTPKFLGNTMDIKVISNCEAIKDQVKFKVQHEEGFDEVSAELLSNPSSVPTRAGIYTYTYRLHVPTILDSQTSVKGFYGNKETDVVPIAIEMPVYGIETDALAKKVKLRIKSDDSNLVETVVKQAKIYNGNSSESESNVYRDSENGIIEISGLQSGSDYSNYALGLGTVKDRNHSTTKVNLFHTETEQRLVNGDFSLVAETINIQNIQVGGKFKVSVGIISDDYTIKSSIVRSTPNGWATLNDLTCWTGSSNQNTWFLVPSTFVDNNEVVIRTVGYNHNGVTPPTSGGNMNQNYYCENAPTKGQLVKQAGELFLGSYSYNGTANRSDGIVFSSRPSTLSFDYKYDGKNGEKAEAYIQVLKSDGTVISEGSLALDNSINFQNKTVTLSPYQFGDKASNIRICFRSSNADDPAIEIPTGSALKEDGIGTTNFRNATVDANSYKAFAKGSELIIDNVNLGY